MPPILLSEPSVTRPTPLAEETRCPLCSGRLFEMRGQSRCLICSFTLCMDCDVTPGIQDVDGGARR